MLDTIILWDATLQMNDNWFKIKIHMDNNEKAEIKDWKTNRLEIFTLMKIDVDKSLLVLYNILIYFISCNF